MLCLGRHQDQQIMCRHKAKGEWALITHRGRVGIPNALRLDIVSALFNFSVLLAPGCFIKIVLPHSCQPITIGVQHINTSAGDDRLSIQADTIIEITRPEKVGGSEAA